MGRGTAWKAHDIDVVGGWMAAGKTTTAMAKLRPDWSNSSIKKLVTRLKARAAAGDCVHFLGTPLLLPPHTDGSQLFQKLRSKTTRLFVTFVTSLLAPPDGSQLFSVFWSKATRLFVTSLPVSQFCSVFKGYGSQFGSTDITSGSCATLPCHGEWNLSHRED